MGTPAYMRPEQPDAKELDGRSDLYALAIVLYRCVTGDVPYRMDSPVAIMQAHLRAPVPDVRSEAKVRVTTLFADVLRRALQKRPDHRFATAAEMRKALEYVRQEAWPVAQSGLSTLVAMRPNHGIDALDTLPSAAPPTPLVQPRVRRDSTSGINAIDITTEKAAGQRTQRMGSARADRDKT